MIESLKKYFQRKEIRKNLKILQRRLVFQSIEQAKNIGVVYVVESEADYIRVDNWIKKLFANGKIIRVIGYHHSDNVPHYCIPKLKHEYYSKKDVNWYGKPIRVSVNDFINEPFDVLIDLTMVDNYTIKHIVSSSNASMKIGRKVDGYEDLYDLMLSLNEEHDMDDLIYFVESYTKQLKGE